MMSNNDGGEAKGFCFALSALVDRWAATQACARGLALPGLSHGGLSGLKAERGARNPPHYFGGYAAVGFVWWVMLDNNPGKWHF